MIPSRDATAIAISTCVKALALIRNERKRHKKVKGPARWCLLPLLPIFEGTETLVVSESAGKKKQLKTKRGKNRNSQARGYDSSSLGPPLAAEERRTREGINRRQMIWRGRIRKL